MRLTKGKPGRPAIALLCLTLLAGCVPIILPIEVYPEDSRGFRPAPAAANCPVPARSAAILMLVNAERARAGLSPVRLSPALSEVAHQHACDNAARQSISHEGSDGSDLSERLRRGGVKTRLAAENTGLGFTSPERAMAWWMASPHHRDNILLAQITEIGVGQADGAKPVWVIDFVQHR